MVWIELSHDWIDRHRFVRANLCVVGKVHTGSHGKVLIELFRDEILVVEYRPSVSWSSRRCVVGELEVKCSWMDFSCAASVKA